MEPAIQGQACTEKFIRSGTARPYMQGRKYAFENCNLRTYLDRLIVRRLKVVIEL